MVAITVGRVCVKLTGRDAGSKCVVTKMVDAHTVEIKSAGRKKERKCNIMHLEPTQQIIDAANADAVTTALGS